MKIREFKETDAEKIAKLSNDNSEVFQYESVTPDFLKRMWKNPNYKLFVLSEGSEVIGFCGVNIEALPIAELGPICVEKSRRMHGLGRLMMEDVFQFLEPLKPARVIIKVKTSNIDAQEFFKTLGFTKVEGVLCGGKPAILMQYGLEGP